MSSRLRRWLGTIAAFGLMVAGLSAVATAPARALSGITQSGYFEVGNLLDYANADFEGTIGDWVPASNGNASLSDDTSHSFLHNDSLKITNTGTTGTSSFRLGNVPTAIEIPVTPGATYRIGAYFKVPAASNQTVRFSLGCWDKSGNYISTVDGTTKTLLNTTKWQYSEDDITVLSNCYYVQGSPTVTLSGLAAGAAVNMDEVIFAPYRAALIIGAHGQNNWDQSGMPYTAADWQHTNTTIGPLQSDKEFYGGGSPALPGQWNDPSNNCYEIEQSIGTTQQDQWPACVINLTDFEPESAIQAFFAGLPAAQMVIMVYHGEPEAKTFSNCPVTPPPVGNAANYVCYFDLESQYIRKAAAYVGDVPNVFVAMDSSTDQYGTGTNDSAGTGCGFIPSTVYTDFYLADHYDQGAQGNSLPNETSGTSGDTNGQKWATWLSCVQSINKPLGLAEYGLDCKTPPGPDQPMVTQQMAADDSYLAAIPGATEPTIMWEYWYANNGGPPGCVFDNNALYNGKGGITTWQDGETQNGGG